MKRFAAGFATGTVILAVGAVGYLRSGFLDVGADVPVPPWIGRWIADSIHASVRRQAAGVSSVAEPSDAMIIAGGRLYLNDCVGCHGEPGKPPSDFGATFSPPAPPLARDGTTYSDAEIFWVAKHGIRRTGMSAQQGSYSDEQLRQLAAFIRRIRELPPSVTSALQPGSGT